MTRQRLNAWVGALAWATWSASALGAQAPRDPIELVKEGRKLESAGRLDGALALYRQAVEINPKLFDAQLAMGRVLDLTGEYAEARGHLEKALEVATDQSRPQALSAMGVSYAFEGKAAEAAKYYQRLFDQQTSAQALDGAAGTANALARVYLESGDVANAEKWYRTGFETATQIAELPADQNDLWEMRYAHALARLAARRDRMDEARRQAGEVKAIVDRGRLEAAQAANYPYLLGYIAYYARDYDTAIAELAKADQRDPFILGLLAQAHEKKGDEVKAREYYQKVLEGTGHILQMAFARPLAMKKLGRRPQGGRQQAEG